MKRLLPFIPRSKRASFAAATLITVWAAGATAVDSSDKKQKSPKEALKILGPGEVVAGGVGEPSGIAYHPKLGRLFVVGDEGRLAELDAGGKVLRSAAFRGNLEDVAVHPPSGLLLLLSETSSELIVYDPAARQEKGRRKLDAEALLGEQPRQKAHGFEGLAFKGESGASGVLYLVHQRGPAMVVTLAWDGSQASGPLGADAVKQRWRLEGHEDLTAAAYVPSLDRLLVIAEAEDLLLIVKMDGHVEAEVVLAGVQQEGLCLDAKGTLWVADDRAGGLRRFAGALGALTAGLKAPKTSR